MGVRITAQMVRERFVERFAQLDKRAQDSFTQRVLVHDYECFPNNTLLVTLDIRTGEHRAVWGAENIRTYLRQVFVHDDTCVFVGFNNKAFDNKITDVILAGYDDRGVKHTSNTLVEEDDGGLYDWKSGPHGRFRPEWVKRTFDIGFDIGQKLVGIPPNVRKVPEVSLKRWCRLNGYEVHHCPIPFDRTLTTRAERDEVERYGVYDVLATSMLLLSDEGWNPCFNARRMVLDEYGDRNVDWVMTKPQLTCNVLRASEENYDVLDDWMDGYYTVPDSLRIWKYRDVLDLYRNNTFRELRKMSEDGGYRTMVCGVPHDYGVGGVHGRIPGVNRIDDGNIFSIDAASLYPNLMRHYNLLSRRVVGEDREEFFGMIDRRTKIYKPQGDTRSEGLKLMLNSGFGVMNFLKSPMYDPVNFLSVTITGQLLITDLLEKMERYVEVIQSNTDGVFFRLRDTSPAGLAECQEVVRAFEMRTRLEMEWSAFDAIFQRDVSNYVVVPQGSNRPKTKGTWFSPKHCTYTPYLYLNRVHKALYDETLPPDEFAMDRFSVSVGRDKNSDAFSIDGRADDREWLDVVPVVHQSGKAQEISVILKDDGSLEDSLFGDVSDNMAMRKRRKATGCPPVAALAEHCTPSDLDLSWYELDNKTQDPETPDNYLWE